MFDPVTSTCNFEQELQSIRHTRKKAEVALRAGIFYIKKYSIEVNYADLEKSADYFRKAKKYSKLSAPNRIHTLSQVYLLRIDAIESRHDSALDALKDIESEVDEIGDTETRAVWCTSIALLYYYLGDFSKAHSYSNEALNIYTELGFHYETMLCLYNCSIYLYEIGYYRDSFVCISHALELGILHGSPFLEYYYILIGKICLHNENDYDNSISYIHKGIEIFRQKGDSIGLIYAYTSTAIFYLDKGEIENAMVWFDECIKLNEEHAKASTYFLLHYGDALCRQRKYAKSLEVYEQTFAISRIRNDVAYIAKSERRIATVLFELSQYSRSQELLNVCLEYFTNSFEDAYELSEIYHLLSKISEQIGDAEMALSYYKLHHHWEIKYYEQKKRFDMENAKHRLDIEIATREREELKLKTTLLERDLDSKRGELTSLALALSQKNQLIDKLYIQLKELSKKDTIEFNKGNSYNAILKELELLKLSGEMQWNHLQQQFEGVDNNFSLHLVKRYESLTQIEVKICLLIRLNLSTKDIAHILWISPRTVETHRYQIRKKMNLNKVENLYLALASI